MFLLQLEIHQMHISVRSHYFDPLTETCKSDMDVKFNYFKQWLYKYMKLLGDGKELQIK